MPEVFISIGITHIESSQIYRLPLPEQFETFPESPCFAAHRYTLF